MNCYHACRRRDLPVNGKVAVKHASRVTRVPMTRVIASAAAGGRNRLGLSSYHDEVDKRRNLVKKVGPSLDQGHDGY